jgi:hypothetical protein
VVAGGGGHPGYLSWVPVIRSLVRAWRVHHLVVTGVIVVLVWLVLPNEVPIPLRDGLSSVIWPLAPVLVAAAVPGSAATMHRDLERSAVRPLLASKSLLAMTIVIVASVVAAIGGLLFDLEVVARNTAMLVGIGFLVTAWFPAWSRWLPVVFLPMAMWLLGARPSWLPPASWAVLLHPAGSGRATMIALVCALAGVASYLLRELPPSRWSRRPRRDQRSTTSTVSTAA